MQEWRTLEDGWRTWSRVTGGAEWRYAPSGTLYARRGATPIIVAGDPMLTTARRIVAKSADELAAELGSSDAGRWYLRALLAIGCIECPRGDLPCPGDCRKDGKPVPCGSPGADAPRSIGLYQFLRTTAAAVGASWDELASSRRANHVAASRLAHREEPRHALDFPTLAVLWNAGSVKPDAGNAWGVHVWSKDLLTTYARAWNAVGMALEERPTSSGAGGGIVGAILAALLLGSCAPAADPNVQRAELVTNEACRALLRVDPTNVDVRRVCAVEAIAAELLDVAREAARDGGAEGGAP
jgi:hypothetical protein